MIESILAAIISLPLAQYPRGADPETVDVRQQRFAIIAEAIDIAAREATCSTLDPKAECTPWWPAAQQEELAAMLITLAWHETKFILRVHAGQCRSDECDALRMKGGLVHHRARSSWQVQRNPRMVSKSEWEGMVGTSLESTTIAARVATRILSEGRSRCAKGQETKWERPAVSAYATGFSCSWSKADQRVSMYRKVLTTLRNTTVAKGPSAKVELVP